MASAWRAGLHVLSAAQHSGMSLMGQTTYRHSMVHMPDVERTYLQMILEKGLIYFPL